MQVRDKVFVVTGAGSGIGRELSLCLLANGASVAGVDLNPSALETTTTLASAHVDRFRSFVCDVSQRSEVEALPERILAGFRGIDGVINNAGVIQPFVRLRDLDYPAIEHVINVNLFGTLFMIKAFLPHLLCRQEAQIVNLSSMGGFVPVPGQTIYCASKAAVKLMTEGLAAELETTNVKVSVVFPGAVATNILTNSGAGGHERSRNTTPQALPPAEAAKMIVQGIERSAPRIFVGKDAAFMDKLYRLNPGYAAGVIARKMRALLPA